ncbi:MAG: hypothetical protein WBO95_10020 [Candidatus Dechloromonas phosphoritropha]
MIKQDVAKTVAKIRSTIDNGEQIFFAKRHYSSIFSIACKLAGSASG